MINPFALEKLVPERNGKATSSFLFLLVSCLPWNKVNQNCINNIYVCIYTPSIYALPLLFLAQGNL